MVNNKMKQSADETLRIIEDGFYTYNNQKVDIGLRHKQCLDNTKLITPADLETIKLSTADNTHTASCEIEVLNESTVTTIINIYNSGEKSIGVLNFASAKNPGGGFLNGAIAQEECLAVASTLYDTQIHHMEYYEANRTYKSMMYTDHMIYSSDVAFFRDAKYNLIKSPVYANVLTAPAVNLGQVIRKGENVQTAKKVMKDRMRKILDVFVAKRNEVLILGAYGAGVFRNNPVDIANNWHELLFDEGYSKYFKKVIFTVLDKQGGRCITAFEKVYGIHA